MKQALTPTNKNALTDTEMHKRALISTFRMTEGLH